MGALSTEWAKAAQNGDHVMGSPFNTGNCSLERMIASVDSEEVVVEVRPRRVSGSFDDGHVFQYHLKSHFRCEDDRNYILLTIRRGGSHTVTIDKGN
ncbi:unnamed protein product [Anisakis simplex]|uniref:SH2 domain-containing protein n=1 Tax=Anisakis simplex TaxID=6269 RepID=A0A0M3KER0_ANISI|nr:unnamed protein product [Anisakis simplex]